MQIFDALQKTTIPDVFTILKYATDFLTSHNIIEAKIDAEVLLCDVLNIPRKILPTLRKEKITQKQYDLYIKYLKKTSIIQH